MAVPTGTHTATVSLGYVNSGDGQQIYYLGSYYNSSCYSFYKGPVRWLALSQYPGGSLVVPEAGAMFKSLDNGATWTLTGGLSPDVSSGGGYTSPAYDVGFAAFDDVGLDPNVATKITAIGNTGSGALGHYAGFRIDFDFTSETWSASYGAVDYPALTSHAAPVPSSTPSGGFAYSLIGVTGGGPPNFVTAGASVVGTSPWMIIDAVGNAHIGPDPAGHFGVFGVSQCGNVRIRGGSLVFAQPNITTGHMEVLSRPVASSTWTVETVPSLDGLYAASEPPWMSSATDLFYIGANHLSIYLTQKAGGVWSTPVQIWSRATDTNPDLAGMSGGNIYQLIASCNPVLLGLDITFEYNPSGSPDMMLTFHLPPTGAGWTDLVGGCSNVAGVAVGCGSPPAGAIGVAYSHTFPAIGGTTPYTFSITTGTLPPGLTLTSGTGNISGTPTLAGDFPVTVRVTDSTSATGIANCSLHIGYGTLSTSCGAPPVMTVGQGATYRPPVMLGSIGLPPVYDLNDTLVWTFPVGVPPGFHWETDTLSPNYGYLVGTPTTAGTFSFTYTVSTPDGQHVTNTCPLTVGPAGGGGGGGGGGSGSIDITCGNPPNGKVGVVYNHTFPVVGATGPTTYSVVVGALPPGVTLDPATGDLTGTPTAPGTYSFSIKVQQ